MRLRLELSELNSNNSNPCEPETKFRGSQVNSGGPRPSGPSARQNAWAGHAWMNRFARFPAESTSVWLTGLACRLTSPSMRSHVEDVDHEPTLYVLAHGHFVTAAGPVPRTAICGRIGVDP